MHKELPQGTYTINFEALDDMCSSRTTTPQQTTTVRTTTHPTTTLPPNIFISLKGDYDMSFEYTTLFINGKKVQNLCKDCKINCNLQEPELVETGRIDVDNYCTDEDSFIEFSFIDSKQVNECPSTYKVCINMEDEQHCCETTCEDEDCENYVAFDCDTWECVKLKKIMVKRFSCSKAPDKRIKCNFNVVRNKLNERATISILLFDEKNGKIYYASTQNLDKNYIGRKTIYLQKVSDCEDKDLQVVLNIFSNNILIYTQNFGRFRC